MGNYYKDPNQELAHFLCKCNSSCKDFQAIQYLSNSLASGRHRQQIRSRAQGDGWACCLLTPTRFAVHCCIWLDAWAHLDTGKQLSHKDGLVSKQAVP